MLKNVLLSGLLATSFLAVFSTANAMEPDERELSGATIKILLKDKELETKNEKITIEILKHEEPYIGYHILDSITYKGKKNPNGTSYTFLGEYQTLISGKWTGPQITPNYKRSTIFEIIATFKPLNP